MPDNVRWHAHFYLSASCSFSLKKTILITVFAALSIHVIFPAAFFKLFGKFLFSTFCFWPKSSESNFSLYYLPEEVRKCTLMLGFFQ